MFREKRKRRKNKQKKLKKINVKEIDESSCNIPDGEEKQDPGISWVVIENLCSCFENGEIFHGLILVLRLNFKFWGRLKFEKSTIYLY